MTPLRLVRENFDFGRSCVVTADGWISNAHWSLHPSVVSNAALFASKETIAAFINADDYEDWRMEHLPIEMAAVVERTWRGRPATAFRLTQWHVTGSEGSVYRVAASAAGVVAYFRADYLALLGLDRTGSVLYGVDGFAAFCDVESQADWRRIIMPIDPDRYEQQLPPFDVVSENAA
jgi:hypothetical protein